MLASRCDCTRPCPVVSTCNCNFAPHRPHPSHQPPPLSLRASATSAALAAASAAAASAAATAVEARAVKAQTSETAVATAAASAGGRIGPRRTSATLDPPELKSDEAKPHPSLACSTPPSPLGSPRRMLRLYHWFRGPRGHIQRRRSTRPDAPMPPPLAQGCSKPPGHPTSDRRLQKRKT